VLHERRLSAGPMLTELATSYDLPPARPGQPFAFLTFRQAKPTDPADAGQQLMTVPIGDAATEEVTVNGQPGIWVEEWRMSADFSQRLLIWEQDGFSLAIAGTLPRDEMFRIAESVEFVGGEPSE
jgi:hypothetical protein